MLLFHFAQETVISTESLFPFGNVLFLFVGGDTFVGKMLLRLWVVLHLWEKCYYVCGWCYICGKNVVTFVDGVTFLHLWALQGRVRV